MSKKISFDSLQIMCE